VVVKAGYSRIAGPGLDKIDYGVVLQNTSPDSDGKAVQVTISAVDAQDHIVKTVSTPLFHGIPAGGTYYLGGSMVAPSTTARVDVLAFAASSEAKQMTLPAATDVHIEPSDAGGVDVVGDVSNTGAATLSKLARITAVVFDANGDVVGGGWTGAGSNVPPGQSVGFTINVSSVAPAAAASAEVSVEPESATTQVFDVVRGFVG
jgi:hypothetical protein